MRVILLILAAYAFVGWNDAHSGPGTGQRQPLPACRTAGG